jgi:hypothetical protein
MKLTKPELRQLIKEEYAMEMQNSNNAQLVQVLNALLEKIENLDISIDYLTAAITGESPMGLDISQQSVGRYMPSVGPRGKRTELE